jgi:hypothetical protein
VDGVIRTNELSAMAIFAVYGLFLAEKNSSISGTVLGAPKIFVSLIAAQKIHRFAVFGQGRFDSVRD